MKRSCTLIAFCALVAGCDAASKSITGPAPGPTDATTFTLAGRVQDGDGVPVAGAVVHLDGPTGRQTALSDERGEYQISGLRGRFAMTVTQDDYGIYTNTVFVAADQRIDITLHRATLLTLTAGITLRGTIKGPPCDPAWDAQAPCVTVHFTPPETGTYELLLTWKGPSAVDLLINGNPELYSESYTGEIRVYIAVQAGVRRDLQIHAYHLPYIEEPFELTASLTSGS
jgi:hypothetical protein